MALSVVVATFCLRNTHCFIPRENLPLSVRVCVCVCVCARACAFVRARYGACKRYFVIFIMLFNKLFPISGLDTWLITTVVELKYDT
jgi:hypothetical protein